MGCDIHWHVERRLHDGAWRLTHSKRRWFATHDDVDWESLFRMPEAVLGQRDYELFGLLSHVRDRPRRPPALRQGLPSDISAQGDEEIADDTDLHSHGWTTLAEMRRWRARRLVGFRLAFLEVLGTGRCDQVAPSRVEIGEHEWEYADLSGRESAHQALQRRRESGRLVDWRDAPDAVRLLIAYDN